MSRIDQRKQTDDNQTAVAGRQYNAEGNTTHVEGDLVEGDKIGGDKITIHIPPSPLLNLRQIGEPVADFVGRETEIETLLAAFEGAGRGAVISGVRGMGGVGKTELAKVLAKRLKERFPDGQIAFNLRGARDDASSNPATAAEALTHVVRAFHPEAKLPEDVESLRGLYHSVLDGKRVLLLMDNALDAGQLTGLVPPPDGCGLIVTSRHHFVLAGMASPINLGVLSPEKSRELLLQICSRIREQADALAERCGYLPLALRLAASALASHTTLGVTEYLDRLKAEKDRLATLDEYKNWTNEERGVEASLAISYRLLDKRLQQYWRALGVFPGDFDTAAAGAVWQLKAEDSSPAIFGPLHSVSMVLGKLHAASMVLWDEATSRFRLHDLTRDYARARLSEAERTKYAQRHAAHYAAVFVTAELFYSNGGDSVLEGLDLCDREWNNIRTGQAWAAACWKGNNDAANLCNSYTFAGAHCLGLRLSARERVAWLLTAVEAARKLGDRKMEGYHLGNLGTAYRDCGDPRKAVECYNQSLDIVRGLPDQHAESIALDCLGVAWRHLGEPQKAIECHEQALAIARKISDRGAEGNALGNMGNAYMELDDPHKAIELCGEHILIAREIGDRRGEGNSLGNLGNAYRALGNLPKAIDCYEDSLVVALTIGDQRGELGVRNNLASLLAEVGRRDDALKHAQYSVAISEQIGSPYTANICALLERLRRSEE